ncbi:MAG: CRISPR system precrRNA processing endoribonuclease RAMP protein Cas6 [Treponema sp.]|nr:CRISPR system precrRNA processing endoribonuclease RAMP protein Cas6 [Treponema sp.]
MTLTYLPIRFHLRYTSPAYADTPPLFILRSMLGKNLRSMSCIARQNKCPDCMYNKTCAYAFLFETILSTKNEVAPGRDRASHPFAFTGGSLSSGNTISEYDFTITLFGKACEYLPYIYASFVRAGTEGIYKSRTQFEITKVCIGEKNILIDTDHIDTSIPANIWKINEDLPSKNGEVLVDLHSPLRFKYGGKYGMDFTAQDFMSCLFRRMKTLCALYGSLDSELEYAAGKEIEITDKRLEWKDNKHYSARQKKEMSLGGVTGTFKLLGTFTALEQNLLDFSKLFNAGKNTNFGLGQFDFWTKWE